jgi:ABC-2 type transport system permease protein
VLHALLVSLLLVAITVAFGHTLYSADVPTGATLGMFLVMLVVGSTAFCALGFAITTVIPNADAAAPIVNATILPLLFLSGVFIPIGDNAPAWIPWTDNVFPDMHFADGMQAGFLGNTFAWSDILVVALWGVLGLAIALRFFSWVPRR